MVIIKSIEQDEYIIVDSIITIMASGLFKFKEFSELKHELLRCNIFIQYPLLLEVIEYMKKNDLVK